MADARGMVDAAVSHPYEILEHTADIGIRAWGRTLEEAFANMAMGMMSLIIPKRGLVLERDKRRVEACAADLEGLLVAWLEEFVYLVDAERFLVARVEEISLAVPELAEPGPQPGRAARLADDGDGPSAGAGRSGDTAGRAAAGAGTWAVSALVWGERMDPARHPLEVEIKGVSYHMLKVERTTGPVGGRAAGPAAACGAGEAARGAEGRGDAWMAQAIFDV
ncbi:MAG: archease [Betaproteobacteria bacterium]